MSSTASFTKRKDTMKSLASVEFEKDDQVIDEQAEREQLFEHAFEQVERKYSSLSNEFDDKRNLDPLMQANQIEENP